MSQEAGLQRLIRLEQALGSPSDPTMPMSFAASLHADETESIPEESYRALRALELQALFVPSELGGELRGLDQMVLELRSIFRRDPAIGLGFGVTTFMAALPVWHSGSFEQRKWLANAILTGRPVSVAFHEPAHGNDLIANEFAAEQTDDGFLLSGQKNIINNIGRAAAATVFVRTGKGDEQGLREHSLLLLNREFLSGGRLLSRTPTLGARACELRGWQAQRLAVPRDTLIGAEGRGFEIVAHAFQISRAVLPGMALGIVDTAWRQCHHFLSSRLLFSGRAIDIPLVQRDLSNVFIDLLSSDAVALASARMAHVMPGQLCLTSCVTKSLVPHILADAMKQLSVLLGARHYVREGDFGYVQKLLRDLPVVMIGHASSDLCLSLLIPQLYAIARFSRKNAGADAAAFSDVQALRAVFNLGSNLPPLRMDQLALNTRGRDAVLHAIPAFIAQIADAAHQEGVADRGRDLAQVIQSRFEALVDEILNRGDLQPIDQPSWFDLAKRYAQIYAAACSLFIWYFNREDAMSSTTWPYDAQSFDALMLYAVERQLGHPATDANWLSTTIDAMDSCCKQGLSAGLLRLPYA